MAHLYTATGHISYAKSASLYLQLMLDLEIMNPCLHQKFSEKGCLLFGKVIHFGQALVWFNNGTNNNESIEKESWNNTWVLVTLTEEILNGKFHFLCSFPCKRAGYHQWKEERGRQYNPQTQDVNWTYTSLIYVQFTSCVYEVSDTESDDQSSDDEGDVDDSFTDSDNEDSDDADRECSHIT